MIELQMTSTNLDFWLLSRNQSIVSVSPGMQNVFEDRLKDLEAPYDIDDLISNDENCSINGEYYINSIAARYPEYVRLEIMGYSTEGRAIPGISISIHGHHRERKIAYIQGGAHGREWICTPTILYTVSEILANIHAFRSILSDTRLYFVPLVNPDGYEYTHTV
uniref:Peptidase M14 domain-containing protein n=1 Tax=Megaselia scalaris TaxID=36166 RepID=T1H0P5_MEGSC